VLRGMEIARWMLPNSTRRSVAMKTGGTGHVANSFKPQEETR
jgi:hypothetical protein